MRLKNRSSFSDSSGIYELSCDECPVVIDHQTGQRLSTRLAEQRTALNPTSTKKSAFADHCRIHDYDFDRKPKSLFPVCTKGRVMNKLEETETIASVTSQGKILSNDLSATFVTPFIEYIISFAPNNTVNDQNDRAAESPL